MKQWTTLSLGFFLVLLETFTPWTQAQTPAPAPPVREITQAAYGSLYSTFLRFWSFGALAPAQHTRYHEAGARPSAGKAGRRPQWPYPTRST